MATDRDVVDHLTQDLKALFASNPDYKASIGRFVRGELNIQNIVTPKLDAIAKQKAALIQQNVALEAEIASLKVQVSHLEQYCKNLFASNAELNTKLEVTEDALELQKKKLYMLSILLLR